MSDADATIVTAVPPLEFEVTISNEVQYPGVVEGRYNQRLYVAQVRFAGDPLSEVLYTSPRCTKPAGASAMADSYARGRGGKIVNRPFDPNPKPGLRYDRMTIDDVEICLHHANQFRTEGAVEREFWAKARELGYDTPPPEKPQ